TDDVMLESDGKGGRIPRKPPEWTQYPKGGHRAAPFMLWGGLITLLGALPAVAALATWPNGAPRCWDQDVESWPGAWTTETVCAGPSGAPAELLTLAGLLAFVGATLLIIGVAFLVANIEAAALTVAKLGNPATDEVRLAGEPTGGASAGADEDGHVTIHPGSS
ncbi:MAG: hypothetical protein FWD59_10820, partial [Micrococcales bacterium]|nr:hypothetical protein [Micrococcales bacterium]